MNPRRRCRRCHWCRPNCFKKTNATLHILDAFTCGSEGAAHNVEALAGGALALSLLQLPRCRWRCGSARPRSR